MPSKNVENRKAAGRKWANNNKEKRRTYQRILWIARKANPIPQVCTHDNCTSIGERHHPDYSKPAEIVWLCRKHHLSTKHKGVCSICGEGVLARGYCNKHYKSERQKIDPAYKIATILSKKEANQKAKLLAPSVL